MKRILSVALLSLLLCFSAHAQKSGKKPAAAKPKTTQTSKKKTAAKPQPVDKKTQLRNEKTATEQKRKQAAQQAAQLNRSIRTTLDSVLILDNRIGRQQRSIDSLNTDITVLAREVRVLGNRLDSLKRELSDRKSNYSRAVVYLQRHKTVQQKMLFVFSAPTLDKALRRSRYVREYSAFQQRQGDIVKQKQAQVRTTRQKLVDAKAEMEQKRSTMEQHRQAMQSEKVSQQKKVDFLNKNLADVQRQIKEYQQREAALDAQIERIIQAEIAEAKRKAEEERKRKAEAERKRKEEARRKAEAERKRALEAERRAKTAAEKSAAKEQVKAAERAVANAKKEAEQPTEWQSNDADTKLSKNFAANKGRLPMPITGSYSVVGHYGQYRVNGLSNVTLDNKGIDIRGQQGAQARAVFDGTVSSIFQYGGQYIVMLRHGNYISVYSGLQSVSVRKGANVTTRQSLGAVGKDDSGNIVLHFQLRNLSTRLNPEQWVR